MFCEILALACGGLLGVFLRHSVCVAANFIFGCQFPYGILLVNALGGLVVGGAFELFTRGIISETVRIFLVPGVLGAFTTFSAYSLDTVNLLIAGRWMAGMCNVLLSNAVSLILVYIGSLAVRWFVVNGRV